MPAPPAIDRRPDLAFRQVSGALWRRTWWRAALVPLTVLAPIVTLAPTADHRFNVYWHGGMFRDDPLRIVAHTVARLDNYLGMGNFRPLGRVLEKSLDLLAYAVTDLSGLPVNVSLRLVSFLGAVVLTAVAVLFAEGFVARGRLFRQAPSTLAATVPFAVGGGFVAAGSTSPAVLFGGLYLLSAALVLAVAAAACRVDPDRTFGWWRAGLLLVAGAALASFNEIVYLALPFATAAVLLRGRFVLGLTTRVMLTGAPIRLLALLWLGFLPVFVVVRAVIYGHCADGGCYARSDITLGPAVLQAGPVRMVSWFPPFMWQFAVNGRPWLAGAVPLLALLLLGGLAWRAVQDLPGLSRVDRWPLLGLAAAAFALLALGATLGSLNAGVQDIVTAGRIGQGWVDTAVTAAAGGIVLTVLVQAWSVRRAALVAIVILLALSATASTAANQRYAETMDTRAASLLNNRIALEMAQFDPTPDGNAHRCRLRAEFRALYPTMTFSLARFDMALDEASRQHAGVPFCAGGQS